MYYDVYDLADTQLCKLKEAPYGANSLVFLRGNRMDLSGPSLGKLATRKGEVQPARAVRTRGGVGELCTQLEEAGRGSRKQARRRKRRRPVSRGREKLAQGLSVMKSPIDRLGCFATVRFRKDELIAVYAGQRINHQEAMRRMRIPGPRRINELQADCYIDGSVGGNGTQYINHSCEPNADVLIVDGSMIISPLHDIAPGEEITIDYLNSFEEDRTICQCRSTSCKERI